MNTDWKEWSIHVIEELKRLNANQEKLDGKVDQLVIEAATNTESLKEHMRRTDANEEHNQLLEEMLNKYKEETDSKFFNIHTFLDRFKFFFYICGVTGGILGLLVKLGLLHFQPIF